MAWRNLIKIQVHAEGFLKFAFFLRVRHLIISATKDCIVTSIVMLRSYRIRSRVAYRHEIDIIV